MAGLTGKHKAMKLQHGTSVREFSNVSVSTTSEGRYELTGFEHKVEATGNRLDPLRTVDVEVTVGFRPEDVVTPDKG